MSVVKEAVQMAKRELGSTDETLKYMDWVTDYYYGGAEYYRAIPAAEFLSRVATVDFEDEQSMREFRRFLDRPKIEKVDLGTLGNRTIALSAHCPNPIPDDYIETEPAGKRDNREKVFEAIFGVWESAAARRAWITSEEECVLAEPSSTCSSAPLEVFCGLGKLYKREESGRQHSDRWSSMVADTLHPRHQCRRRFHLGDLE